MKVMALDTSTRQGSVAISVNNEIVFSLISDVTSKHSAKLLPMIDESLKEAALKPQDIDLFVVVNGPGSFTGLRIGLSTIKGFIMTHNKPVVQLSSLEAMSLSVKGEASVASVYDALRGRLFYGHFDASSDVPRRISDDKLIEVDDFLNSIPEGTLIIGEGTRLINESNLKKGVKIRKDIKCPLAKDFISLGIEKYKNGDSVKDVYSLEPVYLMGSAAEENDNRK